MKPCYSQDCAAKIKEQGQALSSSPVANNSNNAWIVNFNNGNDNNKNNNHYVRLVRASECLPVNVPPFVCFFKNISCFSIKILMTSDDAPSFAKGGLGRIFLVNKIPLSPPLKKGETPCCIVSDDAPSFTKGGSGRILSYRALYNAFIQAKKRKKPSYNRLMFEQDWLNHLFNILNKLQQHTWQPLPSVCFVAKRPKAREIHAPDFADRVVHHWLVPQLEAIYEPIFIYDSFANRKGKGTHAAVERLQQFVRQVYSGEGQGGGYYLQLDIHNFFNSIHRPTLYALLKTKIHPDPPLSKEGASSLTMQQSVSPFIKGGLRGIFSNNHQQSKISDETPSPCEGEGRGEGFFQRGNYWTNPPRPSFGKGGGSSLTNQQSVPPFSKGGLRGIYNTPYMPYCANTPNTMLRMFAPLPKS